MEILWKLHICRKVAGRTPLRFCFALLQAREAPTFPSLDEHQPAHLHLCHPELHVALSLRWTRIVCWICVGHRTLRGLDLSKAWTHLALERLGAIRELPTVLALNSLFHHRKVISRLVAGTPGRKQLLLVDVALPAIQANVAALHRYVMSRLRFRQSRRGCRSLEG